ncbi:MAG: hypothetical protein A2V66_10470 [Ignavibacteria bacterium RBG_13_36_8]|nr:MAG: hypothetical protein A2V66_10470 [Ignavibacteria bacterium RBG_13_36_8]
MFKNYLKTALRNIKKHKGYAFINITGLAVGLGICLLILLFVFDEFSYDKYHDNADRIYRVERQGTYQGKEYHTPVTPHPMGPALVRDYPEIKAAVRFDYNDIPIKDWNNQSNEERIYFTDSNVFEVFSFKLLKGDPATTLVEPNSIILTEEMAQKYLNTKDALGKILTVKWGEKDISFNVTGIMEIIPMNSHLRTDFFASYSTLDNLYGPERLGTWLSNSIYTYILLDKNADIAELNKKLTSFIEKYLGQTYRQVLGPNINLNEIIQLHLRPLTEIYLYSNLEFEPGATGDIKTVLIFLAISILILLIACINFMNLSTARSASRAKEVGLRKVVGATRNYLIKQFLAESILLTAASLIIAIFFVLLLLPAFNSFTVKEMSFNFFKSPLLLVGLLGIAVVVGIGAGIYPAFYLSAFEPAQVLQKTQQSGSKGGSTLLRKGLVIFQFSITIILLVGTFIIMSQMNYLHNKKLGFNKEHVIVASVNDANTLSKIETLKNNLKQNPDIISVGASGRVPGNKSWSDTVFRREGWTENEILIVRHFAVDEDFVPTLGMELVAGRNFSREYSTDRESSIILNDIAVKQFGWATPEEAIGKKVFLMTSATDNITMTVIGVLKDFHYKSLHQAIEPLGIYQNPEYINYLSIRIKGKNIDKTTSFIEKKFREISPSSDFEYSFLDENFNKLYQSDERMQQLFGYFSGFAIFIACLGLFGLAAYVTERRTKEIGIRKVMGASVKQIIFLLSKEFVKWVTIANIIAWPVAWLLMSDWLQGFAYRIELNIWPFIIAGITAIIIAISTVMYQSVKAAISNPVDSLKYE